MQREHTINTAASYNANVKKTKPGAVNHSQASFSLAPESLWILFCSV